MNLRATTKWVALALVGLAIAIGVAIAAANLTSQQIGIASESVSAGDTLAPSLRTPEESEEGKQGGHEKPAPGEETTPAGEPPPEEEVAPPSEPSEEANPPAEPRDDYGGSGGGDD